MGSHIPTHPPERLLPTRGYLMCLHRPVARSGLYTLDEVLLLHYCYNSANTALADPASCLRALPPSTIRTLSKHAMPLQFLLADGHIRLSTFQHAALHAHIPTFLGCPAHSCGPHTCCTAAAPSSSLTRPTILAALRVWPALIVLICCKERRTAATLRDADPMSA